MRPLGRRTNRWPELLEQGRERTEPLDETGRSSANVRGDAEVTRDEVVLRLLGQECASGGLDEGPVQLLAGSPAQLVDLVSNRLVPLIESRVFPSRVGTRNRRQERLGQLRELRVDWIRCRWLGERWLRNIRLGHGFRHFASRYEEKALELSTQNYIDQST